MKRYALPLLTLLGGIGCFFLRLQQNRSGFEPDTGLPIPGHPLALLLPIVFLLLTAAAALLILHVSGKGEDLRDFRRCVASDCAAASALTVAGVFLWLAAGAAAILPGITGGQAFTPTPVPGLYLPADPSALRAEMVLGVLTVVSAAALLPAAAACRKGGKRREDRAPVNGNLLLLPPAAMVIRLALSYREMSVNASQQSYYVRLLALVLLIPALFRLSSFAFRCGQARRFLLYAAPAVLFCITALADVASLSHRLFFGGGAVLLLGFMLALLSADAPEPPAEQDA